MTDAAYCKQRTSMHDSRARCLAVIADAMRCRPDQLPRDVQRAVLVHGHECFQIAVTEHDEVPTRVDRPARTPRR